MSDRFWQRLVIGSRIGGPEDFVRARENGWPFEGPNGTELEACLREMAGGPSETLREMGGRGRCTVEAGAAIPAVTERLAELYGLPLESSVSAGSV